MATIYDKDFFRMMLRTDLEKWIKNNYNHLIGSAIFTKNNSLTSKIVRWAESFNKTNKEFVPSHTGSIFEKDGELYIFDMKPPKATIQPLLKYLYTTKDDFVIILRNFNINMYTFNTFLLFHVGQIYPYLSAIRSVFTKRQTKWKNHCSELHARLLDICGYRFPNNFNFECTPLELYNYLKGI